MNKYRREMIQLILAIEVDDARIDQVVGNIKAGFSQDEAFKYSEMKRRWNERKEARTPKDDAKLKGFKEIKKTSDRMHGFGVSEEGEAPR